MVTLFYLAVQPFYRSINQDLYITKTCLYLGPLKKN